MICVKCNKMMNNIKRPKTLAYLYHNIRGEYIKSFQRFDIYECPQCKIQIYGDPGTEYSVKQYKEMNPKLIPSYHADEEILISISNDLQIPEGWDEPLEATKNEK